MALVHRRVFYAKVGMAAQLVEHLREFGNIAVGQGEALKERVLTDYLSGRTDRVVWEWEFEDWSQFEHAMQMEGSDATRAAFQAWERKMNEMIDHAEVENWTVQ